MLLRRNRSDPPMLRMLFDAGTATGLTDGQLLERFATRGGDAAESAFTALVDRHGPMVWRVCRAILDDEHEAEDAFQATFLVLVRRAGSLWVRDSLGPWLHRVASRAAVRARVAAGRRRTAERTAIAGRARSEPIGEDLTGLIHAGIDRLPDRFRIPVVLCDIDGYTYEDAARHLRCPVGTVKSRLARGRERLRGRLAARGMTAIWPGSAAIPTPPAPTVRVTIRAAMEGTRGGRIVSASAATPAGRPAPAVFIGPLRGLAIVGLATAAVALGIGLLLGARAEPRARNRTAATRAPSPEPARSDTPPVEPLTGIVLDPDGRPVAGATVVAEPAGPRSRRSARTGPDGRFELSPGGRSSIGLVLIAYKEGLAPACIWDRGGFDDRPEIKLSLARPAPYVGVVKDRAGRPVAGAAVRMVGCPGPDGSKPQVLLAADQYLAGTPFERAMRTTTDARGRFQIPEMPEGATAELAVTAAGMGEYQTMNHPRPEAHFGHPGTAGAPVEIVLAPAARVAGRVLTRFRSVKVGGLKVAMQGSGKTNALWRETRTDADGRFVFEGLDQGTANVFLPDQPPDGPWTYRAISDVALEPGRTSEVRIELIRGVQVEGQVVDGLLGLPVPGVQVSVGLYGPVGPRSGGGTLAATTDREGRYRFRVPPGMKDFYVSNAPTAEDGGKSFGAQTITIPADARDFVVPPIRLRKGGAGR